MRGCCRQWLVALAGAAIIGAAAAGHAEGFRNIASITANTYFNGDWRVETTDVLLARIVPELSGLARVTRVDSEGYQQHVVYGGLVANWTPALYSEAFYGFGIDSEGETSHEANGSLNYETEASALGVALRADWFPDRRYSYYLPSASGKFYPTSKLGVFGKFFVSVDSDSVVTESFWGELDYRLSPAVKVRGGFTMSMARAFGYTLIAGADLTLSGAAVLRYTLQFLSDTIEYLDSPQPRSGISNGIVLDIRF